MVKKGSGAQPACSTPAATSASDERIYRSTDTSSARAVGAMSTLPRAPGAPIRQHAAQHLATLENARATTVSNALALTGRRRSPGRASCARPPTPQRAAGRRPRAARRTTVHAVARLQHHRQAAVVAGAGLGHHAVDHFPLQHEMLVADVVGRGHEVEQQRAGDVVRQIADHAQSGPNCAKSTVSASASTTVRRSASNCLRSRAARSRSISTTVRRSSRSSSGRVSADRPGPISTTASPRAGATARTMDSTTLSSVRKFWPSACAPGVET